MLDLVEELGPVIAGQGNVPFAFLGHSLGGLLAFELARYCQRHQLQMPLQLLVSGCAAPQGRGPRLRLHDLDDSGFIDALKTYNGTPSELLQHRELMELALPALRADFQIVSDYRYRPGRLLDIPIKVFAGRADDHATQAEVEGWQRETTGAFCIHWFEGDHFFIDSHRSAVQKRVATELAEAACA